jgi:hypothetical protein
MKYKFLNSFVLFSIVSLLFTACIKDDVVELKDQGSTFLKILEYPENPIFFDPFDDIKEVSLFSLRRDANSSASLNTPLTVTVRVDTAAITEYNDDNGTEFEALPDSLYTLGAGITKTGPLTYQMTFQPGEAAKEFIINLNGEKWDIAHKYAMPFVIQDPGGLQISSEKESVFSTISVKNMYDGVYRVTGTMVDLTNSALTGNYPFEYELRTLSETSVEAFDKEWQYPLHSILNAGTWSYYGNFGLIVNFDPVTHEITSITNYFGQGTGGRSAQLDPTGENYYDPATGIIKIKYFMLQPGTTVRTTFDETWEYTGPR